MSEFNNRVIAITGGGGGMGVELVKFFQEQGAQIVVLDAHQKAVDAGVAASGNKALGIIMDVANEQSVNAGFQKIIDKLKRIDVLICGAGVRPMGNLVDMSLDDWSLCIQINLTGLFLCNRVAARHMIAAGSGSIINIASVNGVRACGGMGGYNASKAAVISLTQTLACETAQLGVRVNAILPAQIETPMIAEQVGEERKRREERIPMGRYGKPTEIAKAAAFLASDNASFVTGHSLAVDGGYLALGFMPKVYA